MTNSCSNFFSKRKPLKIVGMVIGGIIVAALLALLLGWIIMLLWNWLMPALFGLGTITYWQGFGIFFLSKLIFGFSGGHTESSHKEKKKSETIRGEVGKGIREEFKKEFRKAYEEDRAFNDSYEGKYEEWWESEGKAKFDEYIKKDDGCEETDKIHKE
ncbi:MAG: hypothetical protein JXB33_01585 [Clostridia bacterium]|nr:hypothetical protein [Clostridia bacterium]